LRTLYSGLKRAFLIVFLLTLFSCASSKSQFVLSLDEAPAYEGPVTEEALRERLAMRGVDTLRANVGVKAKRGKKNLGTYRGRLVFRGPGSIRLRVYDAMGAAAMEALHSEGVIQVYLPREGVLYEGRAPSAQDGLTYTLRDNGGEYVLFALSSAGGSSTLHASYVFDRRTLLNKEANLFRYGERFLRIRFARYSKGIPRLSQLDFPGGYSVRLSLEEPEEGVELPPEIFEPVPHEGARVLPLERLIKEGM